MQPTTKIYRTMEEWRTVNRVLTSANPGFDRNGLYLLKGSVVASVLERSPPSNNPTSQFNNRANINVQVLYEDGSCSSPLKLVFTFNPANPANHNENELEQILSEHQGEQLEGIVGVRFSKSSMPKVSSVLYLCVPGLVEAVFVSNKVVDYTRF